MPDRIDPEELAALLDGTLTGVERDRVLAELKSSEESYQDLMESAALLEATAPQRSLGAPGAAPRPARNPARRRLMPFIIGGSMLAAAAAVVLMMRPGVGDDGRSDLLSTIAAARSATSNGSASAVYGPRWNQPGWTESRGGTGTDATGPALFRAGARFAELELALFAGDTAAARMAGAPLASSISTIDGGALVTPAIERALSGSADARRLLAGQLRSLGADPMWFDLGAWLESARLAAGAGNTAFFDPAGVPVARLRRMMERSEIERLRPKLQAILDAPADLTAMVPLVESALALGAR